MSYESQIQSAAQLQNAGNFRAAIEIYTQLLRDHENTPDLLIRTAIAALSLGEFSFAGELASRILVLNPNTSVAYNILGIVEHQSNHFSKARLHFETALKLSPNDAQTKVNLAETLNALNHPKEAIRHLKGALRLAPNFTKAHYSLGIALKALGDFTGAAERFRSAIDLDPLHADAWKALANLGQAGLEADTKRMMAAVEALAERPVQKAKMLFALFSAHERAQKYDVAFRYLDEANRIFASTFDYDVKSDEAYMRDIANVFTGALFQRLANTATTQERPIFIVGMPRSGTTLIEQVLAGHSQVSACGELNFLEGAVHGLVSKPGESFPHTARTWQHDSIQVVHDSYLKGIQSLEVTTPCFTDKMPENFLFLGVIRLAFPRARIIHCMRDPIDTCLGNYRQLFGGHHPYAYDQSTLVCYYKAYQGLMEHWNTVMGDRILNVSYEDFVEDPESQAQKIMQFCDLAWEPECLDIKATQRSVFTASAEQVRGAISKNFVSRWRVYEPFIKVLTKAFDAQT